jgi:hypothetical protein
LADRAGIEPATTALTERRSTSELPVKKLKFLVPIVLGRQTRAQGLASIGQKTSVFVANKRQDYFQHSFVLAKLCARVCSGKIVESFSKKLVAETGFEPVVVGL